MNRRCCSFPLEVLKAAWKRCFKMSSKTGINVSEERIESGREFQIVGAAARKERETKARLVRGTCKRLEEEDDLRTREGR